MILLPFYFMASILIRALAATFGMAYWILGIIIRGLAHINDCIKNRVLR